MSAHGITLQRKFGTTLTEMLLTPALKGFNAKLTPWLSFRVPTWQPALSAETEWVKGPFLNKILGLTQCVVNAAPCLMSGHFCVKRLAWTRLLQYFLHLHFLADQNNFFKNILSDVTQPLGLSLLIKK